MSTIISATSWICLLLAKDLWYFIWVFLFRGYSCCCHVTHMTCTKVKSIMSRKIPKKNLYFTVFFDHLHVGRFTSFRTGLPVIPISKPVISTGIPVFGLSNSKFEFRPILPIFTVTDRTGDNQFLTLYRYFNPWLQLADSRCEQRPAPCADKKSSGRQNSRSGKRKRARPVEEWKIVQAAGKKHEPVLRPAPWAASAADLNEERAYPSGIILVAKSTRSITKNTRSSMATEKSSERTGATHENLNRKPGA
jgi:hypothetical protein